MSDSLAILVGSPAEVQAVESSAKSDITGSDLSLALADPKLIQKLREIPDRMGFKIGEVAAIVGVKTFVLRYWETEFTELKPQKSDSGQRLYTRKDVRTAVTICHLLHSDRFSIEGAKMVLRSVRKVAQTEAQKAEGARQYREQIHQRVESLRSNLSQLLHEVQALRADLSS